MKEIKILLVAKSQVLQCSGGLRLAAGLGPVRCAALFVKMNLINFDPIFLFYLFIEIYYFKHN